MTTPDLFSYSARRHHHTQDPATSREAAANAGKFAHGHAAAVRVVLARRGPATASMLADWLDMDIYQVRRRITDLKHAGYIEPTGKTGLTDAGRRELEYRSTYRSTRP